MLEQHLSARRHDGAELLAPVLTAVPVAQVDLAEQRVQEVGPFDSNSFARSSSTVTPPAARYITSWTSAPELPADAAAISGRMFSLRGR
ncbi:hypothetical protein [Amycolatopsis sp. CA-126428]|uniref:hypothetical protein n=1 Tax=Amycolatopsis sp. CA-126428 TaxID=2073158 RepID=UPI0011B062D6|nr:hypothetical protein [Amycolatopsis sp. CA-126428]